MSDGIYVLGVVVAPGRGAGSPAQSVSAGGAGEWKQVQSRGTARRAQQPQKSARAGVSDASGFTRPGAQS
eukprot:8401785-Alexandrium_andersonii.AAC.1